MHVLWLTTLGQHFLHVAALITQPIYVTIMRWLGFCSTCVCPGFGDCINWGGVAGAAGAAGAGWGAARTSNNKKKESKPDDKKKDKCAGERRAVSEAQSYVDTYQAQLDAIQKAMNDMASRVYQALDEMKSLVGQADQEVIDAKYVGVGGDMTLTGLFGLVEHFFESLEGIGMGHDIVSLMEGLQLLYKDFTMDWEELLREFATEHNLPVSLELLQKIDEVKELRDKFLDLQKRRDDPDSDPQKGLAEWQEKLKQRQQELADCEAASAN